MIRLVCAVLLVAAATWVQDMGDTEVRRLSVDGDGTYDGPVSQALQAMAQLAPLTRHMSGPRLKFGPSIAEARAVRSSPPPPPTEKDLDECRAVLDAEGHGPDPGSEEWWAACDRLRARGGAPSFDCSKAAGQIEALICADPELAALDVEMARLYQALSAEATGQELKTLRTAQRGWIKGRNDCWKAIGVSVRDCVEASYRDRIRQLRSQF